MMLTICVIATTSGIGKTIWSVDGSQRSKILKDLVRSSPVITRTTANDRIVTSYSHLIVTIGAVVQRVERWTLRSVGRGFKSYSRQRCVTTLGKLFTPMCLCHQAV